MSFRHITQQYKLIWRLKINIRPKLHDTNVKLISIVSSKYHICSDKNILSMNEWIHGVHGCRQYVCVFV
jgi:hypothetical protein